MLIGAATGCSSDKNSSEQSVIDSVPDTEPEDDVFELMLDKVNITTVSSPESAQILLNWSNDENAAGYQIHYCTNAEFASIFTEQVDAPSQTSITLSKGLIIGRTYYIRVRSYGTDPDGNKLYGEWSDVYLFELLPQITNITSVSSTQSGVISVSWSEDGNVAGYQVECSTDEEYNNAITADINSPNETSTSFSEGLVIGRTYYIRTRAFGMDAADNNVYGEWSETSVFTLTPEKAEITAVSSPKSGKISVNWSEDGKVAGYQVGYSSDAGFKDEHTVDINSPNEASATLSKSLVVGRTYYIRVRAYGKDIDDNNVYGEWSEVSSFELKPESVKLSTVASPKSGNISVSWSKDENVSGYELQYSTNSDYSGAQTVDINSASDTSTTFSKGLTAGKTYYIRVRTYGKDINNNKVYSYWSNSAVYKFEAKGPAISSVSSSKSGHISAEWAKASGVSGYQLSYSSSSSFSNSNTVDLDSSSKTSVTFSKGLVVGTTYYIKVRTYTKTDNGITMYGSWSDAYTYQLMPGTPSLTSVTTPWTAHISATWSSIGNIAGYQVNYASNADFTNARNVNIDASNDTNTLLNEGVSVGNTYYIRVRAYGKDASGNKVYGEWSNVKSIACEIVNGIEVVDLAKAVNGSVIKDTAAWSGKTLTSFKKGAILNKLGTSGNWIMVEYNGIIGYVYNKTFKNSANYTAINSSTLPTVADDWLFDNGTDIKTIYNYAYKMYYSASAKEGTIEEMCVQVFKTRTGACYHHAAIMKYLLERAGYEVYYVRGKSANGYADHAWNLVKTSDGWRHYDATPLRDSESMYHCTDAQAPKSFVWDREKYPAAN